MTVTIHKADGTNSLDTDAHRRIRAKLGRPRKPESERSRSRTVRLTPEQEARWDEHAARYGCNRSEAFRRLLERPLAKKANP